MRIAFVTPWFGPGLKGGAEQQAWQLSTRLAARGHSVEALATCCRSFLDDWGTNHLPEGAETIERVLIRRFTVDARNAAAFDQLNGRLLAVRREKLRPGLSPVAPDEAAVWTRDNINSRALEDYITANVDRYDAFVFIPYLYGPTLRGLPKVARKAWMQPCLHDEVYAYLPDVGAAIHASRGLLFLSSGEQAAAARLYGPAVWSKGSLVGAGVEFESLAKHRDAALPAEIQGKRFLLVLGRRDPNKGIDLAIAAFKHRPHAREDELKLVLAGPGTRDYSDRQHGVIDLGLVADEVRAALLWNCSAMLVPSPNESFSRVLFEGWYCGRPALVRKSCDATRAAVAQSGGGWFAETEADWTERIAAIGDAQREELAATGDAGRRYAMRVAAWDGILETCERVLAGGGEGASLVRDPLRHPAAIHQLSPNFVSGDAISNEMAAIRRMLRSAGFASEIIVRHVEPGLEREVTIFSGDAIAPEDGLIYHHSIGSEVTRAAIDHRGPKGLVYHNITPVEFFRPFRPKFARILRDGREAMWTLANRFPVSVGDSRFNADELERFGFDSPGVFSLPIDPIAWDAPPSAGWMQRLADGRRNILFVGRVAPNKRQDRLVNAFSYLRSMVDARLILAGAAPVGDPYVDHVRGCVADLDLENDVIVTDHCSLADLHALYRSAHAFWSFSEHEGFCVPLVEAMWFDVPIVALASSAVSNTLGEAGVTFPWTEGDVRAAATMRDVLTDDELRGRLLEAQRLRRVHFLPANAQPRLARLIDRMASRRPVELTAADA